MYIEKKKTYLSLLFILIASYILFIITISFINKDFFKDFFFLFFDDRFMDFNNSIRDAKDSTVYSVQGVIYPPLINLMYKFIGLFLPEEAVNSSFADRYITWNYPSFLVIYIIIQVLSLAFLAYLFIKSDKNKLLITILYLIFVTSMPVVWAFERGNSIILSCIFLIGFFLWKDSDKKIYREFSLLFLAISAAIKIYPFFFVLVLLKEKRIKDLIKTIIYVVILVFVPFVFYDGYNGISQMVSNIFSFQESGSAKISYYATNIQLFMKRFNIDIPQFIGIGFMVLYLAIAMLTKKNWITTLMITFFILSFSGSQIKYNAMYLFIPIIVILTKEKFEIIEFISLIILVLMIIPNGFEIIVNGENTLLNFNMLYPLMIVLLCISIFILIKDFYLERKDKKQEVVNND